MMSPEAFEKFNKMNHDIRTQMNVITSGIALLQADKEMADRNKEIVRRMARSIDKAQSILDLAYDELRKENM